MVPGGRVGKSHGRVVMWARHGRVWCPGVMWASHGRVVMWGKSHGRVVPGGRVGNSHGRVVMWARHGRMVPGGHASRPHCGWRRGMRCWWVVLSTSWTGSFHPDFSHSALGAGGQPTGAHAQLSPGIPEVIHQVEAM